MSALPLISELADRGIRVRPEGFNVVVSPEKALTPDLLERIKKEKPTLIRNLERVRHDAGSDWDEIASDPEKLKSYFELLMISDMRNRGVVPDHYTATTICKHCGPVPIFEGCWPESDGCPWCFNRIKGLPVPNVRGSTVKGKRKEKKLVKEASKGQ